MNCRKVSRRLSAYIEGNLSPKEISGFEEHLNKCVACQRKLADFKLIIQISGQLERQTPGPHFTNRLMCAINQLNSSSDVFKVWRYRMALSGIAFVAAASLTFFLIRPQGLSIWSPLTTVKAPMESTIKADSNRVNNGFPVSNEALKRDMALHEQPKSDSTKQDSIMLPRHYVQPVGIKKNKKDKVVF